MLSHLHEGFKELNMCAKNAKDAFILRVLEASF